MNRDNPNPEHEDLQKEKRKEIQRNFRDVNKPNFMQGTPLKLFLLKIRNYVHDHT
jgi:hypothetical protein